MNPEDYAPIEYTNAAIKRIELDIEVALDRIHTKISELKLGYKSFYIYVLPFNNADGDKKSIMNDLIGGTV